jgi:hypothetical protein
MNLPNRLCAFTISVLAGLAMAAAEPQPSLKTEHFDRDPGWEEFHNRVPPKQPLTIEQDFGYSATKHAAADAPGEIGGRVQRSTTPSSYALALTPAKTLNDKFSASGTFALTACQPGAGLFFGFFNSQQPGGSGRPIGSLGLDFDFEGSGGRLAVRLITGTNKSCGTFATPYLPGKYRPTPIRRDGTRYHWTLAYDPQAAAGNGQFAFTLASATHPAPPLDSSLPEASQKEARARFPYTTSWTVPLTPGYKQEGATFDRFGLHNAMKAGGAATLYFADLQLDGQKLDLSREPKFIATNNRAKFEEREQTGAHDFGYSAQTNHAGGAPGEIGGGLWRSGDYGYYADRIEPLNLQQRLEARGKVKLVTAGPDSDMQLGWFSSGSKETGAGDKQNFIGIHVGGPTRIGHYFIPNAATANGSAAKVESGPIITPGKLFDWSIVYEPDANGGAGEITVKLGDESSTLRLKKGQKTEGAVLDRFGMFTSTAGGQMVKIFFDDVSYTAK